jgi:aryl-alcohol dehydrogenase-like predicted oxidoreductase
MVKYRSLGNTGLKISEIGLGGNTFGLFDQSQAISIIQNALDQGINFIDTADAYNKGRSEEIIGKAIKSRRSEAIVATKFSGPTAEGVNDRGASRYHILQAVDASLKRLDTEYIDLYYLHRPDATTPISETLRTLDDLIHAGKVRYIGCSNFKAWQIADAYRVSENHDFERFAVLQSQYNLLERGIESEVVPCCQHYGMAIIPWSPLAGGFLSGKYRANETLPPGARLTAVNAISKSILTKANFESLQKLQVIAKNSNHSTLELAIGWLLSQKWIASVIIGTTSMEQLNTNAAAAKVELASDEMAALNGLLNGTA